MRRVQISFGFILSVCIATLFSAQDAYAKKKKKEPGLVEIIGQSIDAALVKPPQDLEVCFSPDEPCDIKLIKFIESAQKSVDVAIFDVTLDQLVHKLLVTSRKIPVRIIVDRRQSKGGHSLVRTLVKGGAHVRYGRQRGIMHNKFTIIDSKMVETGSFNYSNNATRNNQENQIYLANPQVLERYKHRFNSMWDEAKPVQLSDLD